eukprot:1143377-Amphidinium_carterae.1
MQVGQVLVLTLPMQRMAFALRLHRPFTCPRHAHIGRAHSSGDHLDAMGVHALSIAESGATISQLVLFRTTSMPRGDRSANSGHWHHTGCIAYCSTQAWSCQGGQQLRHWRSTTADTMLELSSRWCSKRMAGRGSTHAGDS